MLSTNEGCGLYLHVPFCETKCGYCDFFSVAVKDRDTAPLVARMLGELDGRLSGNPRRVRTIYCGGGTPTILPPAQLADLLQAIRRCVEMPAIEEFTVEANPATVDDEKGGMLKAAGVTRVSMGAQSFSSAELEALERIHSPEDIPPSVDVLRRCGIGQINLDLIFGVPGQTIESWRESLRRAIELEPDHICCYGLTYEPGTRLTAQLQHDRVIPCEEGLEADMYELTMDLLAEARFEQYEISAYAKPGCQCKHNLNYWRNGPYIGVGPSAAGCDGQRRYKNVSDVAGYVRAMDERNEAEADSEFIDTPMLMIEMIMMQLRLNEGLSIEAFRERCGAAPVALFGDALTRLVDLAAVEVGDHIALTRKGRLVANYVMAELAGACGDRDALPFVTG